MVRVDKKAFMRVQWPKTEPRHLPQKFQVPIKQLDGLEQCELGVWLRQRNAFGNAQSLDGLQRLRQLDEDRSTSCSTDFTAGGRSRPSSAGGEDDQ